MSNTNTIASLNSRDPFDVPRLFQPDNCLEVHFPKFFRDKAWADGMGAVQNAIAHQFLQSDTLKNKKKVTFDFTACRWIDPLPLMSALLEISNARLLGMSVDIRLPASDDGPHPSEIGPYQESPNRLLWFLDQEGFFDCLDDHFNNDDMIDYPRNANREAYRHLRVKPSYEDTRCIPMTMLVVPQEKAEPDFAQNAVEKILTGVGSKLDDKIEPQARERLIYKLRVALQEALHNAQEHAYEKNAPTRLIAIYVRYRTGGFGLDTEGSKTYKKHVVEERSRCPGLADDWLTARKGCLEMFVLDRGVGMVHRFEEAKIELTEKYKFIQIMEDTFLNGLSSKPERQTLYGGLHLLHNLLADTGDFIRTLEGETWFASGAPIIRKQKQTRLLTEGGTRMQGLAMHLRLGWKAETDYGSKWAKFTQGAGSEVWSELDLDERECESSFNWFGNQRTIDERFDELKVYGNQGGWILWLVRPHRMKWDILTFIERTVAPHATENTILVIADIPSYEAETYAAALAEFGVRLRVQWPQKFSRIILSTNRWRFAAVDYEEKGEMHGFSKLHEDLTTIKATPPPIKPKPSNFRLAIVRWLKWHDSRILWEEASKRRSTFVPEQVNWGKDESGQVRIIAGYLDFPQTARNRLCANIYRVALARVLGVLSPSTVQMNPVDRLTMSVLSEIHSTEIYEPAEHLPTTQLKLGSVLVSGYTVAVSSSALASLDLQFFVHCSSPLRGCKSALLFWLPTQPITNAPPKLTRIGKTPTIAPEGWKSFEVPRFNQEGDCVGARTPRLTYQDWQNTSPVIVKAGHWSYQGHHDFVTVNIASAVEAAFLEKNNLARFLVSRILPFIGLSKDYVNANWHRLLEDPSGHKSIEENDQTNYGLLVYRSHPSSELVIRRLLEILTQRGRELAMQRIFPVQPVRMRWSGSTFLIPPLVREEIRAELKYGKAGELELRRPILLFDDAAITGRTLYDLRSALSAIEAKSISTMVIANRLRQPADGNGDMRLDYYWRLDMPVMGREGNCPLCHSRDLADGFSSSLAINNVKKEILNWRDQWSEMSPLDNWSSGLRPLPLRAPELEKKYCYRQSIKSTSEDEKYLASIDLVRSTGLSIHVAELHAMTGRDDYSLKKIRVHQEAEVRVELAASQLLLFGNEFDFDIRIELIRVLIGELPKLAKDSSHISLAALAVMGGLGLLDNIDEKRKAANIVCEEGWLPRENYATQVLLAYLVSLKLLTDPNTETYQVGARLLSTASFTLAERLNALFSEILSPSGNAHSEQIPHLMNKLKESANIEEYLIKGALDSIDRLAELVKGIEPLLVRKSEFGKYKSKINAMNKAAESARRVLDAQLDYSTKNLSQDISPVLEGYVVAIKNIANAYFHRIPFVKDYWKSKSFETEINALKKTIDWKKASADKKNLDIKPVGTHDRVIAISSTGKTCFSKSAIEVWIVWYQGIPGIVLDLMKNAVYATLPINDPWDHTSNEKADMWVRVDYGEKHVELILANASPKSSKELLSRLKSYRWSRLEDVGGSVIPIDVVSNTFGIRVRIPYAPYLKS